MPRLSFAHHSTQTSAAIHAEAELNQTVSNPCFQHEIISTGDSPNQKHIVYFDYPDGSQSSFDGREWKNHPVAVQ